MLTSYDVLQARIELAHVHGYHWVERFKVQKISSFWSVAGLDGKTETNIRTSTVTERRAGRAAADDDSGRDRRKSGGSAPSKRDSYCCSPRTKRPAEPTNPGHDRRALRKNLQGHKGRV